ncbi:MAG: prolyl oligopeptidase family serine peptidase, partial [Candidatus Heimdallarchaeaceae archaeon]
VLICEEKALKILNVVTGEKRQLYPFNIGASNPQEFEKRIAFTVTPKDSTRMAIIQKDSNEWPSPLPPKTDFAIDPAWSYDGKWLAWHAWNFPNMAWDTSFIVAYSEKDTDSPISFHEPNVSMQQPNFSPTNNTLAFLSDKKGWLNLWLISEPKAYPEPLFIEEAEHGFPTWAAGKRSFDWLPDGNNIIFVRNKNAETTLALIDINTKEMEPLPYPAGNYQHIYAHPKENKVAVIYSSATTPQQLQILDLEKKSKRIIIQGPVSFPLKELVTPKHIEFSTGNGEKAYALLWIKNSESVENAPVIVQVHGGPTAQSMNSWNPAAQFFASRGFVFAQLNHRGSTGYGRKFTQKLTRNWGIVDTEDSVNLLKHLENKGIADSSRSAIMGGSAGGYEVLRVMTKYPDVYSCGVNLYGVADLFHLAEKTHYFESRYLDKIIGPLPEATQEYKERSPIYHAENIKHPLLVLQGSEDKVVPKEQSDVIVEAVRKNGVKVEYKIYEGEGHGFRKRENISDSYSRILKFLKQNIVYNR